MKSNCDMPFLKVNPRVMAAIPELLRAKQGIKTNAVSLFCIMILMADQDNHLVISTKDLSEHLDLSVREVGRASAELVRLGLIHSEIKRSKNAMGNLYVINVHACNTIPPLQDKQHPWYTRAVRGFKSKNVEEAKVDGDSPNVLTGKSPLLTKIKKYLSARKVKQ